ncbi:MAG: VOC family protein [Chloroflexota bacterium]
MSIPAIDFAHIRLTVTDINRSRAFYDAVFGFLVFAEVPADADAATREKLGFLYGGVIYQFGGGLLGLRPVAPGTDSFTENRVGLDHLSFSVARRADLDAAVKVLDEQGIAHGGVKDISDGAILEFRDPDNIALEVFAPA